MKRYLYLGDTHGDLAFVAATITLAKEHDADLLQCGDWGFVWPAQRRAGTPQIVSLRKAPLAELSDMLVAAGVVMRFVDGNHDEHPALRRWCNGQYDLGVTIAPNVIYQPRGSVYEDTDGTRFLFLGGAPSIDQANRTPGLSWWPEEVITDEEHVRALAVTGPIHVLVTHDASSYPPDFSAKGTRAYQKDQVASMGRVDTLIQHHRPQLHVHGHWHTRYERTHWTGTVTHGLDCNQLDSTYLDDSTLLWSRDTTAANERE